MSAHCPPEEQLEQLLDDRLETIEDAALARHVESCTQCQDRLERLFAGSLSSLGPAQSNPEMTDALLIRLNVRDPEVPHGQIGLALGALAGLQAIDRLLGVGKVGMCDGEER